MDFAEMIDEAVEQAGLDPATLTSRHLQSIQRSLDLLFIELESQGANAEYRQHTVELTVPATTSVVLLPADCIDVSLVTVRYAVGDASYHDTTLSRISRDVWLGSSDRTRTGHPSSFWLSKSIPQDVVILQGLPSGSSVAWSSSDWAFGAWTEATVQTVIAANTSRASRCLVLWPGAQSAMTATINYVRRMRSPGGLGGHIDADRFWLPTIAVGLASKIAQKYKPERYAGLVTEYAGKLNSRVQDEDRHPVTIGFRGVGWSRRRRH